MAEERKSDGAPPMPSHHSAYSESNMRTDATMLNTMNEMLQNVERQYRAGRMRAFAEHNDSVMMDFGQVRKTQEELFKQHLHLEVKLINQEKKHRADKFRESNNFCDHLPQLFEEASHPVANITAKIADLGEKLSQINRKVPDATKDMAKRAAREAAAASAQRRAAAAAERPSGRRRRHGSTDGAGAAAGRS